MSGATILYLYGFASRALPLPQIMGVEEGSEVSLIEVADLACAVSLVPAADYQREPGTMGGEEQLAWVTPRAWRHHEVVRHLHAAGTIVPLKFGTLCTGEIDVKAMLHGLHDPLDELLARFDGKDEWTLRVTADLRAWGATLQATRPELASMENQGRGLPEGRAYFARKRLQAATADAVVRQLDNVEAAIHQRLLLPGIEVAPARARQARSTPERCVTEAALLVERGRFWELEATLANLEEEDETWPLKIELVGPWPPYSFATAVAPLHLPD
jgi:hypothetical protein